MPENSVARTALPCQALEAGGQGGLGAVVARYVVDVAGDLGRPVRLGDPALRLVMGVHVALPVTRGISLPGNARRAGARVLPRRTPSRVFAVRARARS